MDVQASEHITHSSCHTQILQLGLGCWLTPLRWQVQSIRAAVAAVLVCAQRFVPLVHCCDRWLSNNARFKCEPKAAFSGFFLNGTSLQSTWLSGRAGLSKPPLGPFNIQFDTFAASPIFTRNACFRGRAGNLPQDQAMSLACLPAGLETLPFTHPNHFPFKAMGWILQVLCCPRVPAAGAGPASALTCPVFTHKAHSQGSFSE